METNLNKLYKDYLKTVLLEEEKMHETQRIETKRAWMAGFSLAFTQILSEICFIDDDEVLKNLITTINGQLLLFWSNQPGINRKFGLF